MEVPKKYEDTLPPAGFGSFMTLREGKTLEELESSRDIPDRGLMVLLATCFGTAFAILAAIGIALWLGYRP